jgi:hypothetical protein
MTRATKQVDCKCGHTMTLNINKLRCIKCGAFIYYDEKERRRHRTASIYITVMLALGIGILGYLFVEMIIEPLFG